jgi:hypothetical protein
LLGANGIDIAARRPRGISISNCLEVTEECMALHERHKDRWQSQNEPSPERRSPRTEEQTRKNEGQAWDDDEGSQSRSLDSDVEPRQQPDRRRRSERHKYSEDAKTETRPSPDLRTMSLQPR